MIQLRIYININDSTFSEKRMSELVDTWKFFNTPPFTMMYINQVDAGFGTKEWCLRAPLPECIKEQIEESFWQNIGEEIFNTFKKPTKVSAYLERDMVFSKRSANFDDWYGINLTAKKVNNNPPLFDFSGDDPSTDSRFW